MHAWVKLLAMAAGAILAAKYGEDYLPASLDVQGIPTRKILTGAVGLYAVKAAFHTAAK